MEKKTIRDIDVKGKTVLVRCDFNVPMDEKGNITDDTRIIAAIPTIQYLIMQGAKIILCSHLGKPKPEKMTQEEMKEKFSLNPVANKLSEVLGKEVKFAGDSTNEAAKSMASSLKEGEVGLLENTRFDIRETQNDDTLAMEYADLADVYVNDAFGSAHRAHSSTEGVARKMEEQGKETALGFLMQKEVEQLGGVLEKPERPFIVILGGAKVETKIGVIKNLLLKVDTIMIGGKMAIPFLVAQGYNVGDSNYDEEEVKMAKKIMEEAFEEEKEIILPTDVHIAKVPKNSELTSDVIESAENMVVTVEDGVPNGYQIFDIGEQTLDSFSEKLDGSKTVVWNGPLGYTEAPTYAEGTEKIARYIAGRTNAKCVIGGGDSVAAINKIIQDAKQNGEDIKKFDNIHLSTGGGASLEFLEGKQLPGIVAIQCKQEKTAVNQNDENKIPENKQEPKCK